MPREYKLIIPGRSVGKQETQVFTGRRKDGSTFRQGVKPQKSKNFHALVRDIAARSDIPLLPYARLRIIVALPFTIARKRKTKPDMWKYPGVRPDTDNVMKIIKDALQGVIYINDKLCIDDGGRYMWLMPWEKPYTEILIREMDAAKYASKEAKRYIRENGVEINE